MDKGVKIHIAAVIPPFLERGALWFAEEAEKIERAIRTQPWWQKNVVSLEEGAKKPPSELARMLTDLGYQKTQRILGQGEFSQSGEAIRAAAVNREDVVRIEYHGNIIEKIAFEPLPIETKKLPKTPKALKFRENEFVVHIDHGIGIYRGVIEESGGQRFHKVEYAAPRNGSPQDFLFVPVGQSERLSLYIGFETPKIHRLGGQIWSRTKKKIKESAEAFARELLAIYAARESAERPPYEGNPGMESAFAESFPFVETPAQSNAIREILSDLAEKTPMDRILAGDVGFGKTEVAMRAALRAAVSGKQVAVLAPTTILVDQHERTFKKRFGNLPVAVEALSRATPKEKEKETVENLRAGKIDIIIGTHRLLSKDIAIPRLGLLVIDEEQRFGVKQKEHFKKLRSELDILSLSATPIPRTLSLSMAGLRNISQVNDPPPERIAVKNFILPWSEEIVKSAAEAEVARGGQVYVLHNRVETIRSAAMSIKSLVGSARVEFIHGRMDEKRLLKTLDEFRNGKIDILVATTIIENGLDFSNVNTLIVENAARLGLAQAYQIRGRIGRGDRQAYAYFLYPAHHLTDQARERLETLEAFEALGSGYEVALRDLEMRGAGAVLGKAQSGAIQKGGFNLYCQLLSEALETLKAGPNAAAAF